MTAPPDFIDLDGVDGELGALSWTGREGTPTVLAIHGITANAWHFDALAHQLGGDARLVALDLRGRGRSFEHAGPFGIRTHADDVAAVARQLGPPDVLVGHSMGAYVALLAAERHPDLFSTVLAIDGGTPLPRPDDGVEVNDVLARTLGPAIERLRTTWPDRVSYQAMWAGHPAFADGLSIDLQRTLLADLGEVRGGFRTTVNEEAVLDDGRDLLVDDAVRSVLERRTIPTPVLRAPDGLTGSPPPLISAETVAALPRHRWTTIEGTNHYTILLGSDGARAVAQAIREEIASASVS